MEKLSKRNSLKTNLIFTKASRDRDIKISMNGKGRAMGNIFIEWFWRELKYEHVYLNPANGGIELYEGIRKHILFYSTKRSHTSINKLIRDSCFNQLKAVC